MKPFIRFGELYELRILDCVDNPQYPPFTMFGYFDSKHLDDMAKAALRWTPKAAGVYVTMNPVNPDLLARAANRVIRAGRDTKSTSDGDIVARRRLTIDFDPDRPAGISATDEEKVFASQVAWMVRSDLHVLGWPEPIEADSGNGYHLNYAVDLPADDGGLVERFLQALSAKYTTPTVKVDTSLFNPSRIIKLYGTWSRKGDPVPTRPHRLAMITSRPPFLTTVDRAQIETFVRENPPPEPEPKTVPVTAGGQTPNGDLRPGDDFENRADWMTDILGPAGWTADKEPSNGEIHLTRPGKKNGTSATIGHNKGLHVFTDSDDAIPFKANQNYSKFRAYSLLHHNGDDSAAGKALYKLGYGTRAKSKSTKTGNNVVNQIVSDDPIKQTELGNARRLVKLFGHRLRFCKQLGYWLVFDGTRWCPDHVGEVWQCAKLVVRSLAKEAADTNDDSTRKALLSFALKSEEKKRIQAMIDLAWSEPGIAILPEALDRDPWLLNCPNGTVDLRTGKLREHRPEDLITKITKFAYRPGASRQRWEKVLDEIFPGNPEMVAYVKRAAGYSCTGDTGEHALFLPWGKGRNGKNTVLDPIASVLNDYATSADPKTFLRAGMNVHPTGLAKLFGSRFVLTDEVDEGEQLAEALVKRLTGNPVLTARFMRQDFFDFTITSKIWMPANHRPEVKGRDEGIWSRIRLIPFEVFFAPGKRIKNLAKILAQDEGEGILAWIVEGCMEWLRDGLKEPQKVLDATKEYRLEQDVVSAFLEECCISWLHHDQLKTQAKQKASELYECYVSWCKQNSEKSVLTGRKFGCELGSRGYELKESNGVSYRLGIVVKPTIDTSKPQKEAST